MIFLRNSNPWIKAAIFLLGIYVGALLEYYFIGEWTRFWDRVHDWQPLIVGIIGSGTAIFTVLAILSQLSLQREKFEHTKDQSKRREGASALSARSALPVALSELVEYCRECAVVVIDRSGSDGSGGFPVRPEKAIQVVVSSINHVEEKAGLWLADLVREYQVCVARLEARSTRIDITYKRDSLYDLACLQLRIDNAFPFSRGETDIIPKPIETYPDLMAAFKSLIGISDKRYHEYTVQDAADQIRQMFHDAPGGEGGDYSLGPETLEIDSKRWS